jgi:hypothetical protein
MPINEPESHAYGHAKERRIRVNLRLQEAK